MPNRKKIMKKILIVLLGLMVVTGCTKDNLNLTDTDNAKGITEIVVNLNSTRVSVDVDRTGKDKFNWTDNDQVFLCKVVEGAFTGDNFSYTLQEVGTNGTGRFVVDDEQGEVPDGDYIVVHTGDLDELTLPDAGQRMAFRIRDHLQASADFAHVANTLLVSQTTPLASGADIPVSFQHLLSYVEMRITGDTELAGQRITSVKITPATEGVIADNIVINAAGAVDYAATTYKDAITIDVSDPNAVIDADGTILCYVRTLLLLKDSYQSVAEELTIDVGLVDDSTEEDSQVSFTKSKPSAALFSPGRIQVMNISVPSAGTAPGIDFSNGMFLLNEGNMTSENGSLLYIDSKGTIYDEIYKTINTTSLGNVCQDMFIRNGKLYIISQNGGADGKLVIANASTLVKEQGIATIPTITTPSHIAVTSNNTIYLRGGNGLYRFDPQTNTVTKLANSADKNRMVAIGDKVFAHSGSSLYVFQDGSDAALKTLGMGASIAGIIPAKDGKIWVATSSKIFKLDPTDYSSVDNTISGASISVPGMMGSCPMFGAYDNLIYFRSGTQIWCHDFTANTTEQKVDAKTYLNYSGAAGTFYNGLGVHPVTGDVCYSSIKGYGWDFLINYIGIFDFSNALSPLKAKYDDYTHFPAGIYYPQNFN